ncbi:MAG: hypothetical protein ACRCY6_03065 [Bacteroidales bacterium]
MKSYFLDSISRYKRFSEKLDVKTNLCNKTWWIFNDSGEKEVYIFEEDGGLIISINGQVTNAKWRFLSANKSLIITTKTQSLMVHAAYIDDVVFALQIDGTNHYVFLIDEVNLNSFRLKSLNDVKKYFEVKENKIEEARIRRLESVRKQTITQWREEATKIRLPEIIETAKKGKQYRKWKSRRIDILGGVIKLLCILIPIFLVIRMYELGAQDILNLLFDFQPKPISMLGGVRVIEAIVGVLYPYLLFVLLPYLIGAGFYFAFFNRERKMDYSLIFKKQNGEYATYSSTVPASEFRFKYFNESLCNTISELIIIDNNSDEKRPIVNYMQKGDTLQIIYRYKRKQIAFDSYQL